MVSATPSSASPWRQKGGGFSSCKAVLLTSVDCNSQDPMQENVEGMGPDAFADGMPDTDFEWKLPRTDWHNVSSPDYFQKQGRPWIKLLKP